MDRHYNCSLAQLLTPVRANVALMAIAVSIYSKDQLYEL